MLKTAETRGMREARRRERSGMSISWGAKLSTAGSQHADLGLRLDLDHYPDNDLSGTGLFGAI
jgi:hypothetical protein